MNRKKNARSWYLLLSVAALMTLILALSSASAAAVQQPGGEIIHKVIAPPGALDTGLDGVELWYDYGSFVLYRVTDDAWQSLPPAAQADATLANDMDRIMIDGFDEAAVAQATQPQKDPQAANGARGPKKPPPAPGPALQLVQFVGPIKDEWLEAVTKTGATPIQYIASNGYLLWADEESRDLLDKLMLEDDFLQMSILYPEALKVGPNISQRDNPDEFVSVVIQMVTHDGQKVSEQSIANTVQTATSGWTPVLGFQNLYATMRVGDVSDMTSLPDVFWVDERLERELLDEVQGQIIAGNFNGDQSGPSGTGYLPWLDALGFSQDPADYPILDVTDDGIGNGTVNSGDPTLNELGVDGGTTRLSYVANCTNSASGEGLDGHGHINTSIAGGYDVRAGFPFQDPLGYQRGMGISPYSRLAGTRIFDPGFDQSSCGGSDAGVIKSIQDNGAQINTNSWGCSGCAGSYDDSSQAYEVGVRDADLTEAGNQEMIILFSSGNSGPSAATVGTPGNGKNLITVGASENQRPSDEDGAWTDGCGISSSGADNAMDVISFSSRGPSPGGRVKPEVIAPGTHVQGTASTNTGYTGSGVCDQFRPSGQTVFAASSGTSHSTPAVAGVSSLAYYWLENTYAVATPSPAVMKSYLIAHPTYLTGVAANDTLPSNSQGYDMPNMGAMFDDASKYILDQSAIFDNSGETWVWEGAVADPSKPVRIVLAYTDAPGAIGTSPQVNDLNLAADVGASTYLGNVFSGQWSVTGGAADPFNYYEAIFLPAGTDGAIEITVTGFNIAGDGVPNTGDGTDQDFALVCYNCAQTPTFSLNVTPASQDICAPDDAVYNVAVASILGFNDPVTLSASGEPAVTTVSFSVNPVTPPGSSVLTIGNTGAATAGSYAIQVDGASTPGTKSRMVDLNLFDIVPSGPTLLAPADGAVDVSFKPTYSWTAVAQVSTYLLEVASDAGFSNIVYSTTETGTSHTSAVPLAAATIYYWRVTAGNVCGNGTSATYSFTTQAATMVCNGATVDFEDGIPTDWTVVDNTGGTGIVWVTTADPACEIPNRTNGTGEAACADSDAAGSPATPYDTELVTNPFDLTAWGAALMDVKAYYNDITTGGNDLFEVDIWDGAAWTNELTWDEDHMPEDFTLNLSAYAGLSVVQARFRYSGNCFDWYAQVDDIELTCVPVGPPVMEVDPASLVASQGPDLVSAQPLHITNAGGSSLNWSINEDDTACDSPSDILWLSVSPDTGATLPLGSTVVDVSLDSAGLTPGDYTANLCVEGDDPVTPLVQVPVTLTVEPAEQLLCNGDAIAFEEGIPSGWQVVDNTGGTGIVWTTTADPACEIPNRTNGSGEAACADSDASGFPSIPYDTELWTSLLDLSGQGAVLLDVKAYYRDITTNGNDRFEVDIWNGTTWASELSWDEDHEPEDFTLNLSGYIGAPEVRARFRYFGNGYDWYAQVDDIALTCAPSGPPVIGVDPTSLAAEQGPDVQSTQTLNIGNSGGSLLNWNIVEDDTACDSPSDIPWLSVAPDTGTTLPLDSSAVDVTFDSTGLAPGDYTANLCVNNDSAVPVVPVPVMLTVLPPFTLTCNGDIADFDDGIPSGWQVIDNEGNGLIWTTIAAAGESGNYTGGSGDAATASSDAFGAVQHDTEMRSTAIDLSGYLPTDDITLNYLANYQNFAFRDFLNLDISTDGGATWTNLLSWNEDHGSFRGTTGEAVSIDLSAYAGMSGLKLRWHYFDPTSSDNDWYAQIDDASLECTLNPVIDVSPGSLSSANVPGQSKNETLTLGNLGSADLVWSIDEAGASVVAGLPGAPDSAPSGDQALSAAGHAPATVPVPERSAFPSGVLVNDGSFENGPPPASAWTETTDNLCEWIGDWSGVWGAAAYDGVYDYWGGGYCGGVPSSDSVEQSISVPAGGQLSFWYIAYRVDADDAAVDTAYVEVDGNVVWSLDLTQANNTFPNWVEASADLSAYAGQSVNLKIGVNGSGDQTGNIRFDFVEFAGAGCDLPEDISWLGVAPAAGTTAPGASTPVVTTFNAAALTPGSYAANLCVNNNDPATPLVEVPVDMIVSNVPPTTTVSPASQAVQYSDISTVIITAVDNVAEVLSLSTSWSSDGATFSAGLPPGQSLTGPSCADDGVFQTCVWTISGVIDQPDGTTYTIRVAVDDDFGGSSTGEAVIDVVHEDATVTFDDSNPMTVQVDDPGSDSSLPFTLVVHLQETAESGSNTAPGDIGLAEFSVELLPAGPGSGVTVSCVPTGPPAGSGYDAVLSLTCDFSGLPVNTYHVIGTVEGDYYTGDDETVLVVYDPSLGFTTGGGWFYWPDTADPENGYPGDRTNFGYNMKYNKKGQSVKGSLLVIRRTVDGSRYRMKSNALGGLAIGDTGAFSWASFSGKANYQQPDGTEPVGNYPFIVYVEDHGEPGRGADRFWLELLDKYGNFTALAMPRAAVDNAEVIEGGNIVVPHLPR